MSKPLFRSSCYNKGLSYRASTGELDPGSSSSVIHVESVTALKLSNVLISCVNDGERSSGSGNVVISYIDKHGFEVTPLVSVTLENNSTAFLSDVGLYAKPGDVEGFKVTNNTDSSIICMLDFSE